MMSPVTHPPLPHIFQHFLGINITSLLNHYGYYAVVACVALEACALPVPGLTVLIAASVYAGAGSLNVVVLGVLALAAALVGDNTAFWIGHAGGRRVLDALGRRFSHFGHAVERIDSFYERFGRRVVTFARFVEGARQTNGIIAGSTGMRWRVFVVFDAAGAVVWVALWTTLGYVAGQHINTVYSAITNATQYVVVALVILIVGYVLLRRRRRRSRTPDAVEPVALTGGDPTG